MTTPTCPPSLQTRFGDSAAELWSTAVSGTLDWWAGAWSRPDAALDLLRWSELMSDRREPRWAHPHELVLETPVARLRDFSTPRPGPVIPTLVFPPQAGHSSCIVDYSERQSQLEVIKAAGLKRLYALDWVGATRATRNTGIDDYLAAIDASVDHIGDGPLNLVGDCQGGWLATLWAALHPERTNTLTIAGAPVDFHAGEPVIGHWVEALAPMDMSFYRWVVALGDGLMKGEFMLDGFIAIKPEAELAKQLGLLGHLSDDDHVERYADFEDWFKYTQDISGAFYLWIVEHLFRDNALVGGELEVAGRQVDLGRIDAPLYLLGGETDHITPPDQVFALADHTATPANQVTKRVTSGGHLGLFMGTEALRDHWPPLMADVYARSRRRAQPKPARARARRRTAPADPPIPAP